MVAQSPLIDDNCMVESSVTPTVNLVVTLSEFSKKVHEESSPENMFGFEGTYFDNADVDIDWSKLDSEESLSHWLAA